MKKICTISIVHQTVSLILIQRCQIDIICLLSKLEASNDKEQNTQKCIYM